MKRPDADILDDITDAIESIRSHLEHGPVSIELILDAVAMRLLEIGECVKSLSPELTQQEAHIPWSRIAGMRDFLAHHYFATSPEIVQAVIDKDLQPLSAAVARLRASLPSDE